MARYTLVLPLILAAGCTSPTSSPQAVVPPKVVTPAQAPIPARPGLPASACTRDGYEQFFEAFVREPERRAALALPGAPVSTFDVALRDYSWVLKSDENTSLDIDETRSGDTFEVKTQPVERDENDEVVKTLGAQRTYHFSYAGDCWKFASAD
ncbi:hypothetical protein [Lysobacter sp. HA18]